MNPILMRDANRMAALTKLGPWQPLLNNARRIGTGTKPDEPGRFAPASRLISN
ncbi:hypothetical protein RGR602_PC02160 (plasmid) [Rhizobium gallicum bv. gallicum R602sp]|uniref:Uncharacterized protein n=1 Tax=Rhizobium gallicum bv. gallicum R602sp TaxID=1041138 RepID=A0A0B4XHE3_9HYPH|nr:hypothetical protein RGR602_PC02160 [Rhizobium gallicum bv. gallicum R602sp]